MNKRKESPKITDDLLKLYDKDTLLLIKSTFYRRGSNNCDMSFCEYVKTLKRLGFIAGMRIVRIDKSKKWKKDNIKVYNDTIHAKLKDINTFYRENGNPKPKKVIIKMKECVVNE